MNQNKKRVKANSKKVDVLKLANDCKCCGHCCSLGSGYVLDEEVAGLARNLGMKKSEFIKKCLQPGQRFNTKMFKFKTLKRKKDSHQGPCVFLKDNKCSIHDFKPMFCRLGNCNEHGEALMQWFNANYFLNLNDPVSIREYAIYCDMNELIEGAHIKELVPEKKLKKILSYYELKRKPYI